MTIRKCFLSRRYTVCNKTLPLQQNIFSPALSRIKQAAATLDFVLPRSFFKLLAAVATVFFLLSTVTRCVLLWQSAAEVDLSAWVLVKTFMAGFFYDAVTGTYVLAPLTALLAFAPQQLFYRSAG